MAHLVEAPRGHLSGAIVMTTIDPAGKLPKVASYTVVGSIAGQNVSLKIEGALATIAAWFGDEHILVGSLEEGRLALSEGSHAFVLQRMSEAAYQAKIRALQRFQSNIVALSGAYQGLKQATVYAQQVNAALRQYLLWGQARIANQEKGRAWWAGRINTYTACLTYIEPLAAAKVPSWRWQNCVLNVEDDTYYRQQALKEAQGLAAQGIQQVIRLNAMIDVGEAKVAAAVLRAHAVCPLAQNPERCDAFSKKLRDAGPSLIAPSDIAAFRRLAPQVEAALKADVDTATTSNAKLAAIDAKIHQIYH